MLTNARLTLSIHRFALVAAALILLALAGSAELVASHLRSVSVPASCGTDWLSLGPPMPVPGQVLTTCERAQQAFFDLDFNEAGNLLVPLVLLPVIAGLIAGAALVASEIEEGTAQLAWSLAVSRGRWFAARAGAPILVLAVSLIIASAAASDLAASRMSGHDASQSFQFYGIRGWILVTHGLAAFAIAVLMGSIMGRVLPALILASVVTGAVLMGGAALVRDVWLPTQAVMVDDPVEASLLQNLRLGQFERSPSGGLTPISEGSIGAANSDPHQPIVLPDGSVVVTSLVPGSLYQRTELVESALWAALAAVALGASYLVVVRRRPL